MKKTIILLTIAMVTGAGTYVVFAREHMGGGMQGSMMDSNSMMKRRSMMQGTSSAPRSWGMMGMMGSLAGTTDGGVVLFAGDKLMKYDKDLNLVKEVEVKIDWESWNKMMEQHYNMMMQHRKMMMGNQ